VNDDHFAAMGFQQFHLADFASLCRKGKASSSLRPTSYSPDSMALSTRKRIVPLLPRSEMTKRTCPCLEVLA